MPPRQVREGEQYETFILPPYEGEIYYTKSVCQNCGENSYWLEGGILEKSYCICPEIF